MMETRWFPPKSKLDQDMYVHPQPSTVEERSHDPPIYLRGEAKEASIDGCCDEIPTDGYHGEFLPMGS